MMKKFFAFTLAEVLITLTIIGVIAALTIPNLMQSYQEHATVNKVKKFYSTLTNAYAQAVKEYGHFDEWNASGKDQQAANKIYEILIRPYFKITKDCGFNNNGGCFSSSGYKKLNGVYHARYFQNESGFSYRAVQLSDGMIVWWRGFYATDSSIYIDVNGYKEPNTIGIDLFAFNIHGEKIKASGIPDATPFNEHCKNKTTQDGWGCAAWVVYKGNMDYLHCNDLSWNGKNKCK